APPREARARAEPREEAEIDVRDADDSAEQIPRLAQAAQAHAQPVPRAARDDVEAGADHGWGAGAPRPVTWRKICSRFDPACARSARAASSPTVPSATLRPRSMTMTRVQISSTRCSRCDDSRIAAPARP